MQLMNTILWVVVAVTIMALYRPCNHTSQSIDGIEQHKKGADMTEKRIKTILMLFGEALVIWYGMGTPIPTNVTDGIKLIVALLAITYTGWKNHDFNP